MKETSSPPPLATVIEELLQRAVVRTYDRGMLITFPEELPYTIPYVVEGVVKVFYHLHNEELVLYFLQPSQYCTMSLLASVRQVPSRVYAVAETRCQIAYISTDTFLRTLANSPVLLEHMLSVYHQRMEELLDLIGTLKFARMEDRLRSFLARKVLLTQSSHVHLTHEELAHELGTSRVVVSRLLKELERRGIVRLHRGTIEVIEV
ncbi:MAG: Crp/Fnr family transcriptional regulator [Bacteroidota bacterium]|nr:Crp/Fnr family transcriptional regulator [Candidatus Kapabacteria bacterium]MCS7303331.1 Crp/Fnr family transcriptional regulator [Candidatus Kapabacteria bacterium]MCX7930351.1 Crp/Fnr family transcriptional regulator [Chlorobiota bacterium]MDW8075686.1 Crp/Fnr family transcriptional regulator [Bacteroidota bacterium]MDW8272257.1 Crp/Fnr family transcriptional regulator [Bacteroidota bacterium]